MITDAGLQHMADQMAEGNDAAMSHMAIGTGSTAEAAGDTALETEAARVALDSKTRTDKTVSYVGTFPAGTGTGSITEAGVLNAAAAGKMISRNVFAVKNKGANDTLEITVKHTYQRAS